MTAEIRHLWVNSVVRVELLVLVAASTSAATTQITESLESGGDKKERWMVVLSSGQNKAHAAERKIPLGVWDASEGCTRNTALEAAAEHFNSLHTHAAHAPALERAICGLHSACDLTHTFCMHTWRFGRMGVRAYGTASLFSLMFGTHVVRQTVQESAKPERCPAE